jgi:autotransporter-associated beta strand protein
MIDIITTGNVQTNALANDRNLANRQGGQQIGEVILFNTALNDAQRLQMEAYLNYKWFGTGAGVGNLLPSGTPVVLSGGGTLDLSGENFQTVGSLTSSDGQGNKLVLGAAALTVGDATSASFDGVISGSGGSLIKVGSGAQTLTGASTYSGPTAINGGTLLVSNTSGSGTGTGPVAVNSGGTLGGKGFVGGPVTVNGTGIVNPGASVGRLTLNDSYTMAGGTLDIELDGVAGPGLPGGNDVLAVYGAINLSGGSLDVLLHTNPGEGNKYLIVDNLGAGSVQSPFLGLAEGAWLSAPYAGQDFRFQITYQGGTGNDIVLTSEVPEPASALLLLTALPAIATRLRRRLAAGR